jgi:hypothetical protein
MSNLINLQGRNTKVKFLSRIFKKIYIGSGLAQSYGSLEFLTYPDPALDPNPHHCINLCVIDLVSCRHFIVFLLRKYQNGILRQFVLQSSKFFLTSTVRYRYRIYIYWMRSGRFFWSYVRTVTCTNGPLAQFKKKNEMYCTACTAATVSVQLYSQVHQKLFSPWFKFVNRHPVC